MKSAKSNNQRKSVVNLRSIIHHIWVVCSWLLLPPLLLECPKCLGFFGNCFSLHLSRAFVFRHDEAWSSRFSPFIAEERLQKASLRTNVLLRKIKRFGNALLEGVPPYDRDNPENASDLAGWVRQCRRSRLYELGCTIYEKSGMSFDSLDEASLLDLEENYQVCARRSEKKPASKRKNQPSLFDEME